MALTVGFVGLGAMGLPMAVHLVKAGHIVRGFDVRPAAVAAFGEAGGTGVTSATDAAAGADVLVLMVVNAAQARAILFDAGALAAMDGRGTVCLMATCPPADVAAMAAEVDGHGTGFVDAPVSGGTAGAKAGTLTIMAAGAETAFCAAKPLLEAMGGHVALVGRAPGQGAAVKVINQLLCGVHLAAAAEALSLAGAMGVEQRAMLEIVGGSAAASWMLNDRGPRMLHSDPEVTSAVDIFVKDLGIVMEAGRGAKTGLPLAAVAHQLFVAASGAGDGDADDSQVIRAYQRLNGTAKPADGGQPD